MTTVHRLSVLIVLLLAAPAAAAPPSLTHLFPAGGQRGKTVAVRAAGTFAVWPVKVWASGKGVTAVAGKQKGALDVAIAADAAPGVYWLRVHDDQGGSNVRPFVVGTLPEINEKEPNDEPRLAQSVSATGLVVNGHLSKPGDVDCFSVALKKGQTLVASLLGNQTLRSPMDAVLQVLSSDGFVLEQNHDHHGLDPQVAFTVPRDGTYIVRVFAFPSEPDASIRFAGAENYVYRLTMTTGGFADAALPLAVARDKPGKVRLAGWNIPPAARSLAVAADGLVFHPLVANPVRVRVEPHASHDTTTAEPGKSPYQPPCTITGRLARDDGADEFRFTAKKGQPLLIQVEARALGFPLTPVLRVLGRDGKQLSRAEPAAINRDVELSFNPPGDGEYRVEVRDLHGSGGDRHFYRLRIVRPEPDFALSVAADRFQVVPGKPLTIPVQVTRRNGFRPAVTLSVEGLPPGVTAKVGKDTGNVITLTLNAVKAGPAGAFRIVGRSKEAPALQRLATAGLKEFDETIADLWLSAASSSGPAGKKK